MMRQSQQISEEIEKDRKWMSIETGQSILMCDEKVHDLVTQIPIALVMIALFCGPLHQQGVKSAESPCPFSN